MAAPAVTTGIAAAMPEAGVSSRWQELRSLPVELAQLLDAWEFLESRVQPGRSSELGVRRGSSDPVLSEVERDALRRYRNTKRMEVGRLAKEIDRRCREIKNCPTCRAENDWSSPSCEHCGASLKVVRVRTDSADA